MDDVLRRMPVIVLALASLAVSVSSLAPLQARPSQNTEPPAAQAVLSLVEQEAFLANARVVRTRGVATGVTATLRATLTDGRVTHDASIQRVDEFKARFEGLRGTEFNFRDTWRHNVAAYRLDRLLDLGMIPPSVERNYHGKPAAFTWWVDDVLMDEAARLKKKIPAPDSRRWYEQMWHVRLFDQLIYNVDRNLGNLLIDTEWRIWMIDHSRAFRLFDTPRALENIAQCDRAVFERLKALDAPTLSATMRGYLTSPEMSAMLKRRDVIVQHLEKTNALFDWQRPVRPWLQLQ
ncbi:MAG: hypothetical protein H0X67_08790 [Acidobacteria bacterium]|nr:hypothetical protein [Acidobacteriota bacterium]